MAVVEDYEVDNGFDQDIFTGDEPASNDLLEIGTWDIRKMLRTSSSVKTSRLTKNEICQVLHELLKRLRAANLVGRPTKCELGARLNFRTIKLRKRLTTKKKIRSFLGLVGFYQPFLPKYTGIPALLSYLTLKGQAKKVVCGEQEKVA